MKTGRKKTLALLLVMAMLLSSAPAAFAAEAGEGGRTGEPVLQGGDASGVNQPVTGTGAEQEALPTAGTDDADADDAAGDTDSGTDAAGGTDPGGEAGAPAGTGTTDPDAQNNAVGG